tara:strand:- start:93 stop:476 length:384 start_codon:yes stop_codon:yes gene_type:complete
MIYFLKIAFYFLISILIVLSLFPGSLLGLFFYNDIGQQPDLIENPFGTAINHFISYFCISILGLFVYLRTDKFNLILYKLLFLSTILEILHFFIPNRAFELIDLAGNFLGVLVAYFLIKIYLLIIKP